MARQAVQLSDFKPKLATFRDEVVSGLQKAKKELPSKYLYDEVGSQLFDQICTLEEYYPTRTEIGIMHERLPEIVELLGPDCQLIEYGSGSSMKTRILLDALPELAAYVPIDISKEYLLQSSIALAIAYPGLEVLPVCADYTSDFTIPTPHKPVRKRVGYFPGSTIGNFDPGPCQKFLRQIAKTCKGGGLLIGVDLKKDFNILHRAYNDQQGITAKFNMNLLVRINQELGGDFQLDQFRHYAFYNPGESRIEMHLVSLQHQTAHIGDVAISFKRGESIWTESSYKYTMEEFAELAETAGFLTGKVWTDANEFFSIHYLRSMY